jgi:hypothetical protein
MIRSWLGYYGRALRPWMETFSPAQVRVYLYDDLLADAAAVMRDLYRFIGVDDGFRPDLSRRFNVTGRIRNPVWRWLWHETRGLRSHLATHAPHALRGHLSRVAAGLPPDKDRPEPLDAALRQQLLDAYRDDIRALAGLLGRNLDAWLEGEPAAGDRRAAAGASRPSAPPG